MVEDLFGSGDGDGNGDGDGGGDDGDSDHSDAVELARTRLAGFEGADLSWEDVTAQDRTRSSGLLEMITREGPLAVALSLSVVFLIILGSTRSPRASVLIMVPLVFGMAWTGGLMYASGIQLNFFNMVVFPSLVGIGVDEGVHIHHRYREEGPGSLPFVLRRTGMAVTLTTATTMVGYAGLAFAGAVVVLPAMLEVFGDAEA